MFDRLQIEHKDRPGSYTEILEVSFIQSVRREPTFDENLFIFTIIQIIRQSDSYNL